MTELKLYATPGRTLLGVIVGNFVGGSGEPRWKSNHTRSLNGHYTKKRMDVWDFWCNEPTALVL